MSERTDQTHPNGDQTQVTVAEAAQILGLSAEAVRSRLQRSTLKSTKVNGTVYVLLDATRTRPNADESNTQTNAQTRLDADQTAMHIVSLQEQIDWLRREVERKDTLLMTLMQRIPELEAPSEPRESPEMPAEGIRTRVMPRQRQSGAPGGAGCSAHEP
jgi:hypothetical protein